MVDVDVNGPEESKEGYIKPGEPGYYPGKDGTESEPAEDSEEDQPKKSTRESLNKATDSEDTITKDA